VLAPRPAARLRADLVPTDDEGRSMSGVGDSEPRRQDGQELWVPFLQACTRRGKMGCQGSLAHGHSRDHYGE
jgi:hypothetical protein